MSFVRRLIFPPRCFVCGRLIEYELFESPLCKHCMVKYELEKNKLTRAFGDAPFTVYSKSRSEANDGICHYVMAYTTDDRKQTVNRFILNLKNRPARVASEFAARELYITLFKAYPQLDLSNTVVAFIPRSGVSMKKHGFDHMKAIACRLARMMGTEAVRCIKRIGNSPEQKNLTSAEREINAKNTLRLRKNGRIKGKTVVLIDDIITTGTSIGTAAELLEKGGAGRVIAITFARTFVVE